MNTAPVSFRVPQYHRPPWIDRTTGSLAPPAARRPGRPGDIREERRSVHVAMDDGVHFEPDPVARRRIGATASGVRQRRSGSRAESTRRRPFAGHRVTAPPPRGVPAGRDTPVSWCPTLAALRTGTHLPRSCPLRSTMNASRISISRWASKNALACRTGSVMPTPSPVVRHSCTGPLHRFGRPPTNSPLCPEPESRVLRKSRRIEVR